MTDRNRLNANGMSHLDRLIRLAIAVFAVSQMLFYSGPITWQALVMYAGIYVATTAMCGIDPLWRMLARPLHSTRDGKVIALPGVRHSWKLRKNLATTPAANDSVERAGSGKVA